MNDTICYSEVHLMAEIDDIIFHMSDATFTPYFRHVGFPQICFALMIILLLISVIGYDYNVYMNIIMGINCYCYSWYEDSWPQALTVPQHVRKPHSLFA